MAPFRVIKRAALIAATVFVSACVSEKASQPATSAEQANRESRAHILARKFEAKTDASRAAAAEAFALAQPAPDVREPIEPANREIYGHYDDSPVKLVAEAPVSTFSIDVDTGGYANVRRFLQQGRLPVKDAVRVEELINYFSYDYPAPADKTRPFSVTTEVAPTPWNADTLLLRIGLKGYDVAPDQLPPANLVFLIDVSGSMMPPERLPLLQAGLRLLVQRLRHEDRVAIVVYAGASGVVLEPTPGDQKATILAALDRLTAGGSTNGAAGIRLAYAVAQQGYIENGINRVLLATDGDFNVGTVDFETLKNLVEEKRKSGISLSTLGVGRDNYNERLMEQLADIGNGNYAYVDTLKEAHKVLVHEMASTLFTIAKDVKIQVEFNPATVAEYRLIGYENRALKREDFNNDKVDAGEIGAGHTMTALYEIALVGAKGRRIQPSRYETTKITDARTDELAWLRLRYKLPNDERSQLIESPIKTADIRRADKTSNDFRFAAAAAAFGQLLRGGTYTANFGYDDVLKLARTARGADTDGYRGEFLSIVDLAKSLDATDRRASANIDVRTR